MHVSLCENVILEWQREKCAKKRVLLGSVIFLFAAFCVFLFWTT